MFGFYKLSPRARIGIVTILCWIGIVVGLYRFWRYDDPLWLEAFNRIGWVMLALWLAWPELVGLPRWVFYVLPVVIVVGAWKPMLLLYALPFVLLYCFIVPRKKRAPKK